MTMTDLGALYSTDLVTLREVGLRYGLQLVKSFPSTAAKVEWINREYAAGVRHFEVGSFLPASRMPQFADVRELIVEVGKLEGAYSSALAMNERGAADALQTSVNEIVCVASATEAHSQANTRRSRSEAVELVRQIVDLRDASAHKPVVMVGIAMAFGCSISGAVGQSDVLKLAEQCLEAGADVIGVADTVGFAGPDQVAELCGGLRQVCGTRPFNVHLHDTRGLGLANASAALDNGARIIDGALGGLGGCPFAPGATGNIVFEDLVLLCETKGIRTGIDIEALTNVRLIPQEQMPEEVLCGALARAGLPRLLEIQG